MKKTLIHLSEAWYGPVNLRGQTFNDELSLSVQPSESEKYNMALRWHYFERGNSGVSVVFFDDIWERMDLFADIFNAMVARRTADKSNIPISEFKQHLIDNCGYVDETPREKPSRFSGVATE